MEKQQLLEKAERTLSPLESANLIAALKEVSVSTLLHNPLVLGLFVVVLFYAIVKKSRFVLLSIFTILCLFLLVRYTLPDSSAELTASNTLPFAFGCLGIGAVIIYFTFIKTE